jgi:hypothetical protein
MCRQAHLVLCSGASECRKRSRIPGFVLSLAHFSILCPCPRKHPHPFRLNRLSLRALSAKARNIREEQQGLDNLNAAVFCSFAIDALSTRLGLVLLSHILLRVIEDMPIESNFTTFCPCPR